ncbi:MAG TPA: hypothetical protein VME40_05025 [Caulobacteraceae bacterium]|nr:hypothetical protein [Caulobacteraceae bacterium]
MRRDPEWKRAVSDVRLIGHEIAAEVRHSAAQADAAIHHLASSSDRATRVHDDHANRARHDDSDS